MQHHLVIWITKDLGKKKVAIWTRVTDHQLANPRVPYQVTTVSFYCEQLSFSSQFMEVK